MHCSRFTLKHVEFSSLLPPVHPPPFTRHQLSMGLQQCNCSVCSIGRLNGHSYKNHVLSITEPVGRPRLYDAPPEPEPIVVCSVCLSTYGKGLNHNCTKESKRSNVVDIIRNSSGRSKEKIVSSQLKEVFDEKGVSTRGGTSTLGSGGTAITATVGKPKHKKKPPPKFTNESLNRLQLKIGASSNNMTVVGNYLRVHCGRPSVHKLEDHMTERNQKLLDKFDTTKIVQKEYVTKSVEDEAKQKRKKETRDVEKTVVYAKDVEELAGFVMKERNLAPENSVVQIGLDDGQGLFKVLMSVKAKDTATEEPKAKKTKYSEGFKPKDFKDSGVKKLIMLLACPTTERHDNMASLLGLLGIDAIEFGFCCDLKMVLVLTGKQCASSKHCCPFCSGSAPWLGTYSSTTISSLWSNYSSYIAAGADLKKAQKFQNVVNAPLITGSDEQEILGDIFFFPEHHVFTGIIGKLVKEFERKVFDTAEEGKEFMDNWFSSPGVNVSRTVWHGSASFIGNMAELILKRISLLEGRVREQLEGERLTTAMSYINAFSQFDKVVKSCFGQTLNPGYTELIKDFMVTYRSLNISVPLKVIPPYF